jgi:hypothetical protein
MPIKGMTQDQIDAATRAQVAAGASSTDRTNRLPGETSSEANARITAAYKEMTAKPILSQEQMDAGAQVKFVRTGAGGVGENMVVVPIAYDGPPIKVTEFTSGVIPANVARTTGTSTGFNPDDYKDTNDLTRIQAKISAGGTLTPDEQLFMDRVGKGFVPETAPAKAEVTGSVLSRLKADAQEPTTKESISAVESAAAERAAQAAAAAGTKKYTGAELQDIIRRLTSGQPITPEEAAAIGSTVSGAGEPPNKPGKAWVLSSDGKGWVKPSMPTDGKQYNWDDNNGWVPTTGTGLGNKPGAAWILNADKTAWIKPPQPNPTDTWDNEKGWIPAKGTGLGNKPGAAWILSADGKSWVKPSQPNPTDTWDDNKGWVPAKGTGDGLGKKPGEAWLLSPDGKTWIKPTMPKEKGKAFSWDDNKGWIGFTIGNEDGSAADATPLRPVGTPAAFVWDPITKTWNMPPKPTTEGNWVFDPNNGWVKSDVFAGSSGFSATEKGTLALNTFKNTLALFFGAQEMTKPWVDGLYKYVSGFYKTGSTIDEAFNLALQEGRFNPDLAEFTKRFKGIYALTDLRAKGGVVQVPTIAEYFATEAKMGDLLKSSNLGDLANEDFLGDVLGKGVSATEFGNRMVAVFDRIDNASDVNKKTISRFFPTLDRTQLAKALLLGEKGAKQLQQELSGYEVLSAAEQQGLGVSPTLLGGITNEQAQQIAKSGGTYASTLGQFGQISQARETEQKLAEISGVKSMGVSGLTGAVIGKSAKELKALEDLTRQEEARFSGKAGIAGSRTLASQSRANRII